MNVVVRVVLVDVPRMRKPCEPASVQPHRERRVRRHKNVDPEVELFPADKQWVRDIPLHHIGLRLRIIGLPSKVIFPL
jgi:hypothetical protein